jgi:hypothetical protein
MAYDAERLRIPRLVCHMFFYEGEKMITMTALACPYIQCRAFVEQGFQLVLHGLNRVLHDAFTSAARFIRPEAVSDT